jgi:hypothetical protein
MLVMHRAQVALDRGHDFGVEFGGSRKHQPTDFVSLTLRGRCK